MKTGNLEMKKLLDILFDFFEIDQMHANQD